MGLKHLAVLGATGSIGRNTLNIVRRFPDRFAVKTLTAKTNVDRLSEQIIEFQPEAAAVFDAETARALTRLLPAGTNTEILYGPEGYEAAAAWKDVDTVLAAMMGAAGLKPALAAIDAGSRIALANKETLVMAGEPVMMRAREKGAEIIPVDSEHSAIFQCLSGQNREDAEKILLTASGGPFRETPAEDLHRITPARALKHPNWDMGSKITIDSATLMNKGLEVIEACHLFGFDRRRIEVVVHPQSIVHSMVVYRDGSVMAQLGIPDMKGAIAYGISYPERLPLKMPVPDFVGLGALTFHAPDLDKFPCLKLAFNALETGGTLPAVLNAANEIAVDAFLAEAIRFTQIPETIRQVMERHTVVASPGIEDILAADAWARAETRRMIDSGSAA